MTDLSSQKFLDDWIDEIKSSDAMRYENAYWGPRPQSPNYVTRIIEEMKVCRDSYTQGKFIELLGETKNPDMIPILQSELIGCDELTRDWIQAAMDEIMLNDHEI